MKYGEKHSTITPEGEYLNYDNYHPKLIPLHVFNGPKVGEPSVHFEATRTDGTKVRLSDFKGKTVVLEMGSYTCPMYYSDVVTMNELASAYPKVVFLVLYIREAHPGGKVTGHRSLDDKIEVARKLENNKDENRLVLVDDIAGTAHRLYGTFPNSVHIFNKSGNVAFRSDWNNTQMVDQILSALDKDDSATSNLEHYDKPPPLKTIGVLFHGGWRSVWDLIVGLPGMLRSHEHANKTFPKERTFEKK